MRHVFEDIIQRGFIKLCKAILGGFSKEYVAGGNGHIEVFLGMYHGGDLFCESLLQDTAPGILLMIGYKSINGLLIEVSKDLDIALGITVADVQPELIEGIWRGTIAVEPHISALRFTEFPPICFRNQWTGEAERFGFIAQSAADKFRACGHIPPLVVATELQTNAMMLIEIKEIVALKQLIGELCE